MRNCFRSRYATQTYGLGLQPWDCVVLESKSFIALPTLGALVPGWLLVVPKDYYLCLGALDPNKREELVEFVKSLCYLLERTFGPIVLFEHGPSNKRTSVGCGVDYAHLHLVPTRCDILAEVARIAPWIEWREVEGFDSAARLFDSGIPYLLVKQSQGEVAYIGTADHIPSQLIRRAIACYLGRPHQFDWKKYPEQDNVLATLSLFQGHLFKADLKTKIS